jgi:transposase, IS5 family
LTRRLLKLQAQTKKKSNARDPEMHQTKKGNQWFFGLKAHIGVDAKRGLVHSFTTTPANDHDLNQIHDLIHGDESFVSADSGYRGVEKREETKRKKLDWLIAEMPSKIRAWKKRPRINKNPIRTEYLKASIRAKVEHPFRIL